MTILYLFLVLILLGLIYWRFEGHLNQTAVAALGSIFVLLWAVFQQAFIKWLNRPKLRIMKYEHGGTFFRQAPEVNLYSKEIEVQGFYVNLILINEGKTVAYNAQPHLSAFWEFREGSWRQKDNWLPVGLLWAFDEPGRSPAQKAIEEKNLVPSRPYRFNLLKLSTGHRNSFRLLLIWYPMGQPSEFAIGKYCFEVTVSAEGSKPIKRYYIVDFHEASITGDYNSARKKIQIHDQNKAPK